MLVYQRVPCISFLQKWGAVSLSQCPFPGSAWHRKRIPWRFPGVADQLSPASWRRSSFTPKKWGVWWFLRKRFLAMCHHVPCYPYLSMLTTHSQSSCCLGVVQSENCYSPTKKTAPLGSPTCHAAVTACHGAPALKFQPPQEIHGETFGTEMGKEWQRMNRIPVKGHKMNPEHWCIVCAKDAHAEIDGIGTWNQNVIVLSRFVIIYDHIYIYIYIVWALVLQPLRTICTTRAISAFKSALLKDCVQGMGGSPFCGGSAATF